VGQASVSELTQLTKYATFLYPVAIVLGACGIAVACVSVAKEIKSAAAQSSEFKRRMLMTAFGRLCYVAVWLR
jgi:hypothetical protein